MQEAMVADNFLSHLVFSEESTFNFNGVRIRGTENPQATTVQHETDLPFPAQCQNGKFTGPSFS